ncbi:hypothetical protein FTUN_4744 [Frigoriglobus tundricola]|uniref:Uncharacterized protein n=1 Tax=Frigoriglobus tundricola TaxID=2774151 RepID=A0A6M5YTJ4_9BACT|nr:hypothetical protein FTUN_4744 [Frigoriglobus tundricola]
MGVGAFAQHMQQQTGVPPIIMQQVQPAFMQPMMQSQHAWIMSPHILSPLVQVTQHPVAVISHLHMPIVMLQQHTIMPFIVQHMLHIPPAIMPHRFCIMVHAAGSSHEHVIFIPPAHFSTFIVQRGTITMFGAMPVGIPIPLVPVEAAEAIGLIIAVIMVVSRKRTSCNSTRVDWDFKGDHKLARTRCNCDNFGRCSRFLPPFTDGRSAPYSQTRRPTRRKWR